MPGVGILNARSDKRASVVAFTCKSIVKSMEETQDTILRVVRLGLDCAHQPLSKHFVFALERRDNQVFFGTEVLIKRHASDAGLLNNRVDAYRVKADFTE